MRPPRRVSLTESNLQDLLTATEWSYIFGDTKSAPAFSVVRPNLPPLPLRQRRGRRSPRAVILEAASLGRRFHLQLRPSPPLLDPSFVALRRWGNFTTPLPPESVEPHCYYHASGAGDRAALGLCGGVRGVISTPDSKYFIINPLPQRFHNSSENIPHVVMQWTPQGHGHFGHQRSFARRKKRSGSNQIHGLPMKPLSGKYISNNFPPHLTSKSDNSNRDGGNRLCFHERNGEKEEDLVFKRIEKHTDGPLPLVYHASDCEVNACEGDKRTDVTSRQPGLRSASYDRERRDARTGRRRRRSSLLPIYVETAVFVDKDLFRHMGLNFPTDTERELVRVVLAMINAVQLLYHDPSLGRQVNFVLKRVEILHADPASLQRPHDIDRFLSSFCTWQHGEDPPGDSDPLHWDHALILTGLDLYVVSKNGKVSSQVVGKGKVSSQVVGKEKVSSQVVGKGKVSSQVVGKGKVSSQVVGKERVSSQVVGKGKVSSQVVGKGKVSSQMVGLAPVAGMCTDTSSCTVNEGRHFESVYVVAHEIGHNLGMRHDGPLAENECDPSSFIMSPTLGSGKITWSSCSRRYLESFLETSQSQCLMDYTNSEEQLDHSSGGILPGERFNSDQQCMLKYGRGSVHASQQPLGDVCRDLHCQRERYTWTSHPALEGTACGVHKWCRSGRCVGRGLSALQAGFSPDQRVDGIWSDWTAFSDCASGCLLSDAGLVQGGSSGIMVSTRRCNNPRPENGGKTCGGSDRRFRTCNAAQCSNVQRTTIRDFADQICTRAREVDTDLLGTGLQRISSDREYDTSEMSALIVSTSEMSALIVSTSEMSTLIVSMSEMSTLIVSTSEMSALIVSMSEMSALIVSTSEMSTLIVSMSEMSALIVSTTLIVSTSEMSALIVSTSEMSALIVSTSEVSALKVSIGDQREAEEACTVWCYKRNGGSKSRGWTFPDGTACQSRASRYGKTMFCIGGRCEEFVCDRDRYETAMFSSPCPGRTGGRLFVRTKGRRREVTDRKRSWNPASGCHFNCLAPASGLRLVKSPGPCDLEGDVQCSVSSLQLCQPDNQGCGHLKTPFEHASGVCDKYKERVSRLSGLGMQISPTAGEPKRSPSEQGMATLNLTYALCFKTSED
uniref:Peptidase M12B domain-containing protein n=1 Tax=Timema monikensis TaxID=170555 RepID=A0A7R9E5I6_9NEOP|nr:unnamed protein product [Timema monikensis]